jgi:hypothetical protein
MECDDCGLDTDLCCCDLDAQMAADAEEAIEALRKYVSLSMPEEA